MSQFRYSWLLAMAGVAGTLKAADLPVPCIAGSCGTAVPGFVSAGQAQAAQTATSMTIDQFTDNVTLNWQSFNISADGTVTFKQPDASSVALNRIFQADASRIFGSLSANGRIFLVNQNGIVFGEGARVNAAGLIASSLDMTPAALERGIAQAAVQGEPAFRAFTDSSGNASGGPVTVERGATIDSPGGQVLLFAPGEVINRGTIRTPDGQTVLAAGETVFLAASTDPGLRGLLVEVGPGGTVTNGSSGVAANTPPEQLVGQIIAERGNITLAGLAVNQRGRVSATTSVRANGSIRLVARDQAEISGPPDERVIQATRGGTLNLGAGSSTDVKLDLADAATAVDATAQPRSQVRLDGQEVLIQNAARVVAHGGSIDISARANPGIDPAAFTSQNDASRIRIADGAVLDVSGAHIELPMERNVLRVELRGNQLRDSPAQRDGPLRGEAVFVDVRRSGTRADGTAWVGSPIADLFGDVSTIARGVGERNLSGGSIRLQSQGDVVVGAGARLDVSGGQIDFRDGYINTSRLVVADGSTVDIARADPQRDYRGVLDTSRQVNRRWGITETYDVNGVPARGTLESGYVEGKDAGSVTLTAPQLVFDGALVGSTVRGVHQRNPAAAIAGGAPRPFDQVARGASLIVGSATPAVPDLPDAVVNAIRFEAGTTLGSLRDTQGGTFDLFSDELPETLDPVRLRPELFGEDAVRNVSLFVNDSVEVPQGFTLDLGQGGSFNASAGRIQHDGILRLPGGSVALDTRVGVAVDAGETLLSLGGSARIEAQGSWINDNPLLGGALDPLYTSGGTVSLTARQGEMSLAGGSLIDVSGGAQRRADGRVVGGRGGSIALENSATLEGEAFTPRLDAELRGHSFAAGGQLSITAPSVCISATDCSGDEPGNLWLSPALFSAHGFADFRVRSNLGGVSVAPGTQIDVRQLSRLPNDGLSLLPGGNDAAIAAHLGSLPTHELRPTSLSLNSQVAVLTSPLTREEFATAPILSTGAGSVLRTQARGQLSLTANTRMEVDGVLESPAGRIDLTLDPGLRILEFMPSQAISLGDRAHLSVAGTARTYIDGQGVRRGEVLPGGSVNITARRGYVLGAPGSSVDISGTRATLDLRQVSGGITGLAPRDVASAAGRLSLTASEGILWSGNVSATGGNADVAGGELAVALDSSLRNDPGALAPTFPIGPRRIELTGTVAPVVVAPGGNVPASLNGRALLSTAAIEAAGFDRVALAAADISANAGIFTDFGQISLTDVSLSLRGSLSLDASVITGQGVNQLAAPFVSLGHADLAYQLTPENFGEGRGRLAVTADHIDLAGALSFDGFESTQFTSRGDLRLLGVQRPGARRFTGSLTTSANVTLEAAQTFPGTLTDFDIRLRDNAEGEVEILARAGAPAAPVLSVGGSLSISAPNITQAGVLRAPLGRVTLNGESVTLASGSVTSTSLGGQTALFGTTQAGLDWVYELPDRQTLVFGIDGDTLPTQRIELDGTRVNVAAGATVDLSGGGDLLAYEFVPGVGGSRDLLSRTEKPDQFSVLPGIGNSFGPYDPREFMGTGLRPGDSVYLSGTEGLPAGTYTLLPARYALLPGAFLVAPVAGYQDINAGEVFARLDGSNVISGYRTFATTGIGEARSSGFAVRPGSAILEEARYDLTTANQFFSARAQAQETLVPRLPFDAGQLVLSGIERLSLDGQVRSAAAAGARGALVDIAGSALRVVPDASAVPADPNALLIDAGDISRLGAESVLLGGVRRQTEEDIEIEVRSDEVVIDRNAVINAPEVTLAARERVAVSQGATIEARGSIAARQDEALRVSGDGALLRVSAGSQPQFERSDETGLAGRLELSSGATLRSAGSVLLDASLDTRSAATLDVTGASLRFGARQITLSGATPAGDVGLVLDPAALSSLGLRELGLSSRSTIDVTAGTQLSVRELSLDAAGIRRAGSAGDARLAADLITISNRNGVAATPTPAPTGGTLTFDAAEFRLGEGSFNLMQYANTRLNASARWLGEGGTLIADGDLRIDTPLMTQRSAIDSSILAAGALTLSATTPPSTPGGSPDGIGAGLSLTGREVLVDTRIQLPSGRLDISATGTSGPGLRLGSQARLDLAGISREFDGVVMGSPGGRISLDAGRGNLAIDAGAQLTVTGAAGAPGGQLHARAVSGTARIDGTLQGGSGSEFLLDALRLPALDGLNAALNAGGFDGARSLRQRGQGNLVLGPGSAIVAHQVELFADQGGIQIDGIIDTGSAPGGRVRIGASGDINVNGQILAQSGADPGTAARIELDTRIGRLALGPVSRLEAEGGSIHLRLPRGNLLTLADGNAGNDALRLLGTTNAESVTVEGFTRYNAPTDGYITSEQTTAGDFNPWFADAATFMQQAAAIRTGLGRPQDASLHIVPGLEIFTPGDLTLLEDWNLYSWRFDGAPGVLTLRAGGDLRFSASLSDGFTSPVATTLPVVAAPSWSYRLVAGADAGASDPLGVLAPAALGEFGGTLAIDTALVRTGTGSIDVAAARDFVLGSSSSVLYTAGTSGPGIPITTRAGGLGGRTYPIDGGDISIRAGRDIVGAPNNQLVTDWLWRAGRPELLANPSATAWTVNFARFNQGVGALAGGRVDIDAGRDVRGLSANVASIGRQVGGTAARDNRLEVIGGGVLDVTSGRDIVEGKYFVGRGSLRARAGDSVKQDADATEPTVGTVFALGDAEVSALARRDLLVGTIVNPTLLPQGLSQQTSTSTRSAFSTYGAGSAARLFAVAGDLTLLNDTSLLDQQLTSMTFSPLERVGLRVYPPSLFATAFEGDVVLGGSFAMYPDAAGRFEMFANGDVATRGVNAVEVLMSNTDPALLPTPAAPQPDFEFGGAQLDTGINTSPNFNARVPVHAGGNAVAHVVARLGDISIESGGAEQPAGFYFPMPARLSAGRDVRDVSLTVIHPGELDVSTVSAGRDVRYTIQRGERGGINRSNREIVVDGGGRLEITAGRDVDLQTSAGITTRGDVVARGVPKSGADIRVIAGLNGRQPAWQAFSDKYLRDGREHDALLLDYMENETGRSFTDKAAALSALAALPDSRRRPLLEQVFFAELRITGRIAAPLGDRGDFTRAYAALDTLFPGSNPDLAKGEKNAYAGDIRLYFSRMYTLDGGDITLVAPGGELNAGLATPPVAFGIDKSPSQLGIVVQSQGNVAVAAFGDTQVNESRIFSADGGDILIWATRGDIDAGRGAKTAISAPLPSITFDSNGRPTVIFPAALTGSGIQTLATSAGRDPGDVDLFAPRGVVNASDAGIVAGNLTIAATAVLGANNIQVSGVSVGVPVDTGGLAAGLQGVSSVASSSASAATATVERGAESRRNETPLASAALGWLEVFVEGFGEEVCKADDPECLSRQPTR